MTNDPYHTAPRLYTSLTLAMGQTILLSDDQSHYLKHVLRRGEGDMIRVFQERDGEWIAVLSLHGKKSLVATPQRLIRSAEVTHPEIHLFFSPIKKDRNDMLIEKSVELGVTHLHPVLCARTCVRDIKPERLTAQIIEAAEQCERLDIPTLAPFMDIKKAISAWDITHSLFAAIERHSRTIPLSSALLSSTPPSSSPPASVYGLVIGPEGGFSTEEVDFLCARDNITPVSLGPRILRAETAVFYGLSILGQS